MNQKAWIDVGSPRFSYLQPIQHIGVVASGAKPVITPTYYYPAVTTDYWDIVFIS
jgi:hypothetical protein